MVWAADDGEGGGGVELAVVVVVGGGGGVEEVACVVGGGVLVARCVVADADGCREWVATGTTAACVDEACVVALCVTAARLGVLVAGALGGAPEGLALAKRKKAPPIMPSMIRQAASQSRPRRGGSSNGSGAGYTRDPVATGWLGGTASAG